MPFSSLKAQNWNGTSGTATNLYRSGNIGIGYGTAPSYCSPLMINGDMNLATNTDIYRINCNPVLHVSGTNNLFSGTNSGTAITTGIQNTFVGFSSGIGNTSGSNNSFVGDRSGSSNSSGEENVFLGAQSGFSNSTGSANVFVGHQSGYNLTTENDNVLMGYRAGYNLSGSKENVAIGTDVLYNHSTGIDRSVTIGHEAGYDFLAATSNGGDESVQIGYRAGYDHGGGIRAVVIGYEAGKSMFPTSNENVVIGFEAGNNITTSSGNTLLGSQAGNLITSGQENTLLGFNASCGATDGSNTAVGFATQIAAGYSRSTAVGMNATVTGGSNSTAICYNSNACAANTIVIGSNNGTNGNEVVVVGGCQANFAGIGDLEVVGGDLWAQGPWTSSDLRLKKEIELIREPLEIIAKLNGYNYSYRDTTEVEFRLPRGRQSGLIAQELQEFFPYAVKKGANGYLGVNYSALIGLLVESIKDLNDEITSLKNTKTEGFDNNSNIPKTLHGRLYQNTPNPFSSETVIRYEVIGDFEVAELHIYDMSGNLRMSVQNQSSNQSEFRINSEKLNAGIYTYTLLINGLSIETKTMVVSK